MSYALTLRGGRLAMSSLGTAPTTDFTFNVRSQAAAAAQVPDCSGAAITGGDYKFIDDAFVDCCKKIKAGSGSTADKIKGIAQCSAKNGARAAGATVGGAEAAALCVAAGAATAGAAALLCAALGTTAGAAVGGFVYDRVAGYNGEQIAAGVTAGVICGVVSGGSLALVCGIAAAELIGWLTDTVGPLIEGIFSPGAAKRRELAAREAYHAAIEANETACQDADKKYQLAWGLGVHSLKDLYRKTFTTAATQAQATAALKFGPVYDDIARAMSAAGAASQQYDGTPKGTKGCYPDPNVECSNCATFDYIRTTDADSSDPWSGVVSAWTVEGPPPWSDMCPFSIYRYYLASRLQALGPTPSRDAVTNWEKGFAATIAQVADSIYPAMVSAISRVATQITAVSIAMKQQQLIQAASSATRTSLATKAAVAASVAVAAADAARKGNAAEGQAAITRARQRYDIANAAYTALLASYGPVTSSGAAASVAMACSRDVNCKNASVAVATAKKASEDAVTNAAHAATMRFVLGGAVAAGAAGAVYWFMMR